MLTVAWIDRDKENNIPYDAYARPVEFYFDRLWQYKTGQRRASSVDLGTTQKYAWEIVLFDLSTLQPHYVAHTKTMTGTYRESLKSEPWWALTKKLRKERILKKRPPVQKR